MTTVELFDLEHNPPQTIQPEDIYTDLLSRIPETIEKLRSSTGDKLPLLEREIIIKARLESCSEYLGQLASSATFSTVTGCWSILKRRNNKGYVQVYGKKYGYEHNAGRNYGIGSHRLAYILRRKEQGLDPQIDRFTDIDHICRNTACCNPGHLRAVDKQTNNILKMKAERIEKSIAVGQLMLGSIGIKWFDRAVLSSEDEDTGLVVSTRFGPHRIVKISHDPVISYGQREPCEVYDSLYKPSTRLEKRKSRKMKRHIDIGQEQIPV